MEQPDKNPTGDRDETPLERIDRNMTELLNELRVALPGVQVLFAFLLVLPFNQGFTSVTHFQKVVYLVTLLATALAAICLIAPTMHHRIQFRENQKAQILRDANRLTMVGMTALATAMTGAVVLVTDYVFSAGTMLACAIGVGFAFLLVWYILPLRRLAGAGD
jgi:uncharacterized protein involved in cysteine biosynthesis